MAIRSVRPWLAAVVGVVLLMQVGAAKAEEPLNLLFFGNSFTQGSSNVATGVGNIAVADGHVAPVVVADLEGGTDLDYHIGQVASYPQNNVTKSALPAGQTWDYVIMQGYSTEATHINGTNYLKDFCDDALTLYQSVLNHGSGNGAGVKAVLFQTWARQLTNTDFYPSKFANATAMQTEIDTTYAAAAERINDVEGSGSARVATVGDGFADADFDASFYSSDLYHASFKGYRLASLILYRTIYQGEYVSDITYSSVQSWVSLTSAEWTEITGIADRMDVAPEPASMTMLLVGGIGLLVRRKKRSQ